MFNEHLKNKALIMKRRSFLTVIFGTLSALFAGKIFGFGFGKVEKRDWVCHETIVINPNAIANAKSISRVNMDTAYTGTGLNTLMAGVTYARLSGRIVCINTKMYSEIMDNVTFSEEFEPALDLEHILRGKLGEIKGVPLYGDVYTVAGKKLFVPNAQGEHFIHESFAAVGDEPRWIIPYGIHEERLITAFLKSKSLLS